MKRGATFLGLRGVKFPQPCYGFAFSNRTDPIDFPDIAILRRYAEEGREIRRHVLARLRFHPPGSGAVKGCGNAYQTNSKANREIAQRGNGTGSYRFIQTSFNCFRNLGKHGDRRGIHQCFWISQRMRKAPPRFGTEKEWSETSPLSPLSSLATDVPHIMASSRTELDPYCVPTKASISEYS